MQPIRFVFVLKAGSLHGSILALVVVFQPIQYNVDGTESWFTDGGTLDNYPVHIFDG